MDGPFEVQVWVKTYRNVHQVADPQIPCNILAVINGWLTLLRVPSIFFFCFLKIMRKEIQYYNV